MLRSILSFVEQGYLYREVAKELGIDFKDDYRATLVAYSIASLYNPPIEDLKKALFNKTVVVFGAGPSLPMHIEYLRPVLNSEGVAIVSADGATKALVEKGFIPHVIVSDLDGDLNAIRFCVEHGSILVAHVHGDNIDVFLSFIPSILRISRRVVVTTQIEPIQPVMNFGGFTDGDRAVLLALSFYPRKLVLAGMDFGNVVGRYSKPWLNRDVSAGPRKLTKLLFGKRIVLEAVCKSNVETYTLPPTSFEKCVEVLEPKPNIIMQKLI